MGSGIDISERSEVLRTYLLTVTVLLGAITHTSWSAEIHRVGVLGNSGDSGQTLVRFVGKPAPAMGPVLDSQMTLWERGGGPLINR